MVNDVLADWDAIKRAEPGREPSVFGEPRETLPELPPARQLELFQRISVAPDPDPGGPA